MKKYIVSKWMVRVLAAYVSSVAGLHAAQIDALANKAQLIVVGSVLSRAETPTQVSFTINIARVLSGNAPDSIVSVTRALTRTIVVKPSSFVSTQTYTGIWFLTAGASGSWDVLTSRASRHGTIESLFLPAALVVPTGAYAYPSSTPLLDVLVYEIAAGVQMANEDPTILLESFSDVITPAAPRVFATLLASGNIGIQTAALTAYIGRGMPGAIQQLVRLWPTVSGDPHSFFLINSLRDSMRDTTPASVQQLASFAATTASGSAIREAAIRALAAMHTRESLPFLATLLSSADAGEQERAVYGISAFVNGCPVQTPSNTASMQYLQCNQSSAYRNQDTFAHFAFGHGTPDREAAFVSYWQTWWQQHPELQ